MRRASSAPCRAKSPSCSPRSPRTESKFPERGGDKAAEQSAAFVFSEPSCAAPKLPRIKPRPFSPDAVQTTRQIEIESTRCAMKNTMKATLVLLALFPLLTGTAAFAQDDAAAQAQIAAEQAQITAQQMTTNANVTAQQAQITVQ